MKVVRRAGEGGVRMVSLKRSRASDAMSKVARRTRRRICAEQSETLQQLFAACKAVFKGPGTVPSPAEADLLRSILDKVQANDLGLSPDMGFFASDRDVNAKPIIIQTTVYKSENFSMEIFFLPSNAVIPLHNHPGMTVFSKVLLGSMHIKSYDWLQHPTSSSSSAQLAKRVRDSDLAAHAGTEVLYPAKGGNIHSFTAHTASAMLDVLGPPYSKEDDRDCTYYREIAASSYHLNGTFDADQDRKEQIWWLEEIEKPSSLQMQAIPYRGPQIIEVASSVF